jgi:Holliday junction resolvase
MSYRKGYAAENQLVHELYAKGWAVLRAPRSGCIGIASPDIVAAKDGKLIVIECKSRQGAFTVPKEQIEELNEWVSRAGAVAYVGWKISRKGWFFLTLDHVAKRNGNVGKKDLDSAIGIGDL